MTPGRLASPALARSSDGHQFESILAVDRALAADRDDAVDHGPVAGLVRLDDVLHVLAEARPELGRHELQSLGGHRGQVGGQFDAGAR